MKKSKGSGEEINYTIKTEYDELIIRFVVVGGNLTPEESFSKKIDKYLSELKEIIKRKGHKRATDRGNFLDIRPSKDYAYGVSSKLSKVRDEVINLNNVSPDNKIDIDLINWRNSLWDDGFTYEISGGDKQVVVTLKRRG